MCSSDLGALLLTNNGALTLRLTHPRYGHPRTYRIWVQGRPSQESLRRWAAGVPLDGQACQPVRLHAIDQRPDQTRLQLVMREGRNRQIRRTAQLLGHPVLDLKRVAIGPIQLADLPEGGWRPIEPCEGLDPD